MKRRMRQTSAHKHKEGEIEISQVHLSLLFNWIKGTDVTDMSLHAQIIALYVCVCVCLCVCVSGHLRACMHVCIHCVCVCVCVLGFVSVCVCV